MRIAFTAAISLAALAHLSGLASAQTAQHDIVGAWDIFEDSCESGYLEYRADGSFEQVYRRDAASWIVDPVWGGGTYRLEGDTLFTGEQKLDGAMRIESKQRLRFSGRDRVEMNYLNLVWIDNATGNVNTVADFKNDWPRCPQGTLDRITPLTASLDHDAALMVGRWGWERGCASGYVEYTVDGQILMVELDREGEDSQDSEFEYGFYQVKDKTLLEVYAYDSGIWKSESNYAFDDHGRLFFSDGMNPTWSDLSGATEDSDPFFEVLFNCAGDEATVTLEAPRDAREDLSLDDMLFDSDVARVARIIDESRSHCPIEGGGPEATTDCIEYVWSVLDVSGDRLLSLSEIARGLRMFAKWSAQEQARSERAPLDSSSKLGIHVLGVMFSPLAAKPLLDSYDYDDDGRLSREELFADTDFADALALSQRPMTDFIDLESIISKLRQIMLMTMGSQ